MRVRELQLADYDIFHAHGDNHLRLGRSTPTHVRTLYGSCFSEALHIRGAKNRLRMFALGLTEVAGSITADATVAISQNTRLYYPWVNRVIPCGVDRRLFRPGEKDARPTILFVGTYHRRKRGRLLMDVFEHEVLPAVPDAQLWMVCSDAPAAPNVEVLGGLTDDELADRYRRAWLFCLPSTYEGFGVPYIEAMASGTPVVATANPGALEVVENGRYGMITPAATLGASIVGLLTDQEKRDEIASRATIRARDFDWEVVAASYERLYREVLGAQRGPARESGDST
jgi:glycosyltransferase involved in cell wall biosynthesis